MRTFKAIAAISVIAALVFAVSFTKATPPTVLIPSYGVGYSETNDLLKQLLDEVRGLRKDVQALRAGQHAGADDYVGAVTRNCASCHGAAVAADKGSAFVLVEADGKPAELSVAERRRVAREVERGRMPPGGKLSDADKKLILGVTKEVKP